MNRMTEGDLSDMLIQWHGIWIGLALWQTIKEAGAGEADQARAARIIGHDVRGIEDIPAEAQAILRIGPSK